MGSVFSRIQSSAQRLWQFHVGGSHDNTGPGRIAVRTRSTSLSAPVPVEAGDWTRTQNVNKTRRRIMSRQSPIRDPCQIVVRLDNRVHHEKGPRRVGEVLPTTWLERPTNQPTFLRSVGPTLVRVRDIRFKMTTSPITVAPITNHHWQPNAPMLY
jgi:hypothetical protein